jgi:hippurate hydrolase
MLDGAASEMLDWRRRLHERPELAFEETETAAFVAERLRSLNIDVTEGIGGTGVVGRLSKGTSDRRIGLRADMDALAITEANTFAHASRHKGRMHACGHDGHTAMLLGAAAQLARSNRFNGTVTFIFQPAEENGKGAQTMLDDGLFERFPVDAVFAMHNLPGLEPGAFAVRPGAMMACEDTFEIRIDGRGAHAALPHRAIDPIVIGAEIVTALQTITSRNLDALDNAVVSVTDFDVAATRNILPGDVTLRGDCRSFCPEVQACIESRMRRIVDGICAAHGARGTVAYQHEFAATVNTQREADLAKNLIERAFGTDKLVAGAAPLMASEDFGLMLQHRPGAYLLIGNGTEGAVGQSLHSPDYDFNDAILPTGAAFWTALVEHFLPA